MKNTIVTTAIILASSFLHAQVAGLQTEHSFGGKVSDFASDIIQTPDGGFVIAGTSFSTDVDVDYDHHGTSSTSDIWVVKMNADQSFAWSYSYGGSGDDSAFSIINTPDGGFMVAGSSNSEDGDITGHIGESDVVLLKLRNDGALQWEKNYGGSAMDGARQIIHIPEGYAIAGYSQSFNDAAFIPEGADTRNNDGWLFTVDMDGLKKFDRVLGGSLSDHFEAIKQTAGGKYIAVGSTYSDNGFIEKQFGNGDAWVVQLSDLFDLEWERTFGGSLTDGANAVTVTPENKFLVAGFSQSSDYYLTSNAGGSDIWLFEVSCEAAFMFQYTYGGSYDDIATDIDLNDAGNYMISGYTNSIDGMVSETKGHTDFCIINANADGTIQYEKNYGGSNNEYCYSTILLPDDKFMMAGSSYSTDGDIGAHIYTASFSDYWYVEGGLMKKYYMDADHDGFGDAAALINAVAPPCGYITDNTDCNDADAAVHPAAEELCNGFDDDCNGVTDEAPLPLTLNTPFTAICMPETVVLNATPGYDSYNWYKNGVHINGVTGATLTVNKTGTYSVTVSSGLCSATATTPLITFYKLPTAGITAPNTNLCGLVSVKLKANSGVGYTYAWTKNGNIIPGATSQIYYATEAATYRVVVSNAAGCTKMSAGVNVINACKLDANDEHTSMQIFPDPATTSCTVQLNENAVTTGSEIRLYNLEGAVVYSKILSGSANTITFNIDPQWSNGMYVIVVTGNEKQYSSTLMIKH